jgi:hypothetical protein
MAVGADLASIPLPDVPDKDIVAVYAKLVGELLCITINTVPEIMYALSAQASQVNVVCANRQIPVSAWSALWLRRCQLGRRQVFSPQHAVCYVLCCNGAAFSWKSALAPNLALSTSEAELISVASCAQEVNFCRKLATELGFI